MLTTLTNDILKTIPTIDQFEKIRCMGVVLQR